MYGQHIVRLDLTYMHISICWNMSIIANFKWSICLAWVFEFTVQARCFFFVAKNLNYAAPVGGDGNINLQEFSKLVEFLGLTCKFIGKFFTVSFFVCNRFLWEDGEWVSESKRVIVYNERSDVGWPPTYFWSRRSSLRSLLNWMMVLLFGVFLHHLEVLKMGRLLQVLFVSDV